MRVEPAKWVGKGHHRAKRLSQKELPAEIIARNGVAAGDCFPFRKRDSSEKMPDLSSNSNRAGGACVWRDVLARGRARYLS